MSEVESDSVIPVMSAACPFFPIRDRAMCEPRARRPKETTFLIEFKPSPVVLVEGTCDRSIVREC